MSEPELPACRHRGARVAKGYWTCHSNRLVIPGRTVDAEMCLSICPYVDHEEPDGEFALAPSGNGQPHPQMSVDDFLRQSSLSTRAFPPGWPTWEVAQLAHQRRLESAACKAPPVRPPQRGKGVVIPAGGPVYFPCAVVCATLLRRLGCRLPIEFWHLGPGELNERMASQVAPLEVTCRDALQIAPQPRLLSGWELKPFSIIHSDFEEVLYLDADNLPARDPTDLFQSRAYQQCGAVFWPDLDASLTATGTIEPAVWNIAQIAWREGPAFESGQILVDKSRCWRELQLAMHLNEFSDFWYRYLYGDKDTFKLAWHKLERAYGMPETKAAWQWPAIHQFDFAGELLFTHACQGKPLIVRGQRIPGIPQAEAAMSAAQLLNSQLEPAGSTAKWDPHRPEVIAMASRIPCRHRGDVLSGNGADSVYLCQLHGRCTNQQKGELKSCLGCEDWLVTTPAQPLSVVRATGLEPDPHQFNASILEFRGKTLLAYRLKEEHSEIWLCELDGAGRALWNRQLSIPQQEYNIDGCEDPRLFLYRDELHLTYAGVRKQPRKVIVSNFYCRLDEAFRVAEHFHPSYARRRLQEKNWQYFEHAGELFAVYTIAPHVVLKIAGNHATELFRHSWPVLWQEGELRGGASPVLYGEEYYCFFHGASDATFPRTYTLGCYTFSAAPPFTPRRVSQLALLRPDADDHPGGDVPYCVYPCGAIFRDNSWLISYGYYDREVRLVAFSEGDVERALTEIPPSRPTNGKSPEFLAHALFSPWEMSR